MTTVFKSRCIDELGQISGAEELFNLVHLCSRILCPRLRKESPEKYGSYVNLVPDEWTKVALPKSQSFHRDNLACCYFIGGQP
jgi:hypothetical protein